MSASCMFYILINQDKKDAENVKANNLANEIKKKNKLKSFIKGQVLSTEKKAKKQTSK